MKTTHTNRQESGNVLFLILIAVALFAALSYAVTSSTRSGSGSTDREQSLLGSASLTQYPTALRTSIIRMILSGLDPKRLAFNTPANFGTVSTTRLVFHPDGGGAVYQNAPADVMGTGGEGTWYHNAQFSVPNVGRDGTNGNDIIAFLPGINQITCERIDTQMGFASSGQCTTYQGLVPEIDVSTNTNITTNMTDTYTFPNTAAEVLQCTGGTANAFTGKATGCFYDPNLTVGTVTGNFVFYSVILER